MRILKVFGLFPRTERYNGASRTSGHGFGSLSLTKEHCLMVNNVA